jgi:TolB-like protein/DNA-binding winged helix-turn-helix (wHTH) protein
MNDELSSGFRLKEWEIWPLRNLLNGPDGEQHIEPKAMQVLVALASEPGEVVTREFLLEKVWPDTYSGEVSLTRCISQLRRCFSDDRGNSQFIETIPKVGYRLVAPVEPFVKTSPRKPLQPITWVTAAIVVLFLGVSYLVYDRLVLEPERHSVTVRAYDPAENSIAVLPFDNMSADPEQEYFSDGISEEILNLLAQIESLKVIARTSSFSFKGKDVDIATMAGQMNVRYILEGSVRRSGSRVRITAQLIDAKDSSNLWSEAYDRDYSAENLIEVQSEIARAITGRLRMTLTGDDEERLVRVPTQNTEAYAAYLLGRERLKNRKVAELAVAVEQFSLAIELDPQFAATYAGLADACGLYDSHSGGQSNELCPSSLAGREQLARKALELDPESAEAWISLGTSMMELGARMHRTWTYTQPRVHVKLNEAHAAFERGLELNPTLSEASGRWESVFDRGLEVDPLSIPLHARKSWYPITVSSKEEAMWHAHRIVEIAPGSPRGYETVGNQEWELNGRIDESIRWMSKAMEIDPQRPGFPVSIGLAYSALGDPDMALAYLDLAKALTAPDNEPAYYEDQCCSVNRLLVEQAIVRLVSGKTDAHQVAEQRPPLISDESWVGRIGMRLAVFVDLATGRPADALARMAAVFSPECIGATESKSGGRCPSALVRVYQELGDHKAAQALSDANVRQTELLSDYRVTFWQFRNAGRFATAGRTDAALEVLENLVSSGWRGDNYNKHLGFVLCCDVRFDAIRDHERFRAIVATIEADMAQQLENVRDMQRRGEVRTLEEVNALIASAQERD